MPRPRAWDPPYQDDRDEILMIDSGQDPAETREALVMARRALSLLYQNDPHLYDKYAAPLQKLIDQLPGSKKTQADYLREQNEAKAQRAREAREAAERMKAPNGNQFYGNGRSFYDGR